jgi:hypothetical protein
MFSKKYFGAQDSGSKVNSQRYLDFFILIIVYIGIKGAV